jgi:hypothetical protein
MILPRKAVLSLAVLSLVFVYSSTTHAGLVGELGILDVDNANGGINPATGVAWAEGDTYHLAFVTSETRNALSTDINDYNAFVQGVANSSSLNLGDANWNVIASTEAVNARTNTGTTGTGGVSIFKVDGVSKVANNYGDLWNGLNPATEVPNLDEEAMDLAAQNLPTTVFTGTTGGGATVADRWLGTTTISNNALRVTRGLTNPNNTNRWMQQFNNNPNNTLSFYALSDPLTIQAEAVPEPASFAVWGLIGFGLVAIRRYRRKK